jgi:hypothetical protein
MVKKEMSGDWVDLVTSCPKKVYRTTNPFKYSCCSHYLTEFTVAIEMDLSAT